MRTTQGRKAVLKDKENQRPCQGPADPVAPDISLAFDYLRASHGFKEVQKKLNVGKAAKRLRGAKKGDLGRYSSNEGHLARVFQELDSRKRRNSDHLGPGLRKGKVQAQIRESKPSRFCRDQKNRVVSKKSTNKSRADSKIKIKKIAFKERAKKANVKNGEAKLKEKTLNGSKKLRRLSSYQSSKSIFGGSSHQGTRRGSTQYGNSNNQKKGFAGLTKNKKKTDSSGTSYESNVFGSKKRKEPVNNKDKARPNKSPSWKKGKSRKQVRHRMKLSMVNMSLGQNALRGGKKPLLSCRNTRRSVFFPEKTKKPPIQKKLQNKPISKSILRQSKPNPKPQAGRRPVTSIHHLAALLETKPNQETSKRNHIFENIESNTSILVHQKSKDNGSNAHFPLNSIPNQEYDFVPSNGSFMISQIRKRAEARKNLVDNNSAMLAKRLAPPPKKTKNIFSLKRGKEEMFKNNMAGFDSRVFNYGTKHSEANHSKNSFVMLQSKLSRSVSDVGRKGKEMKNEMFDMRGGMNNVSSNQGGGEKIQEEGQDGNEYIKIENPFNLEDYRNKHLKDVSRDFQTVGEKRKANVSFLRAVDSRDAEINPENRNQNKQGDGENQRPNVPILRRSRRAHFLDKMKNLRNLSSFQISLGDESARPQTHRPKKNDFQEQFERARSRVQINRLLNKGRGLGANSAFNLGFGERGTDLQNLSMNVALNSRPLEMIDQKACKEFSKHSRVSSNQIQEENARARIKRNLLHRKTPSLNLNFVPGFRAGLQDLIGAKGGPQVDDLFQENYDGNSLQSFERDLIHINGIAKKVEKPVSTLTETTQAQLSICACPKLDLKERIKTVEWLSTISYNFRLLEKTLALAVECFDYYLERNSESFEVGEYQFLGLSCLFMASKYEEIYPPNAHDFVLRGARRILINSNSLACNIKDSKKKIDFLKRRMFFYESEVLACLEFNASRVLTIDFLSLFAFDAGFGKKDKRRLFALYLLNLSYLSPNLCSIRKSLLAFSIVYFVNKIFGKGKEWPNANPKSQRKQFEHNESQKSKTVLGLFFADKMSSAEKVKSLFEQNFKFHGSNLSQEKERPSAVSKCEDEALTGKCPCQQGAGGLQPGSTCTGHSTNISNQNNTLHAFSLNTHPPIGVCSNRILSLASENLHIDTTSTDLRTLQNSQNNNEITSSGRAKDSTECSTGVPPQKCQVEKQLKKISSFRILNAKSLGQLELIPDQADFDFLLRLPPVQFELWKPISLSLWSVPVNTSS